MKKLIKGIVDFRKKARPSYRETFAKLALGQSPDCLFIACSDSRVVPNLFASTDPGDLFVVRNVGNLVCPCGSEDGHSAADESEAAALEFAILNLKVRDIIVCGHSECGAMQALLKGREKVASPNLRDWLRHGEGALEPLKQGVLKSSELSPHNQLSQLNVLQQVENLKSYPVVKNKIATGELSIHSWWFELSHASVYSYDENQKKFIEINETTAQKLLDEVP